MPLRVCIVLLMFAAGCSGPYSGPPVAAKSDATRPVKVFRTEFEVIPEVISATGELLAEELATIGTKIPGRAKKLYVDLGSSVQAGQVLAEIEKDDYEFRVKQAEALVTQIRARLGISDSAGDDLKPESTAIVRQADAARKEARFVFETTEKLQKEGILSRIDFEKAQLRRDSAEAAYQAAVEEVMQLRAQLSERRAQLELARQNLADCIIRAPFAGGITHRQASQGEYLPVNAPIVTLVRQHPLRLRLEVPERAAGKVRVGQRVEVRIAGVPAIQSGRVARLSPAIEAESRSLVVEAEIPNQAGLLRPGSFAEASLTVDPFARGLAVPRSSIRSFAGIDRVFVVRNGILDDKVVKTGRSLPDGKIVVTSGLDPGVDVVLTASDRLSKGQKVIAR